MDRERRVLEAGAILIEGTTIVKLFTANETVETTDETDVVDLEGRIVLPGLVNTHVHTSQSLARGLGDDVSLITWLHERIWPYESKLTHDDSYVSTLLCGIEMIKSGVTTFLEAGGQHVDAMATAVQRLGLRAVLCKSAMDTGDGLPAEWAQRTTHHELNDQVALYDRWHNRADGRIKVWFGVRTIFNASDELLVRSKAMADARGVGLNMHVAELQDEVEFARATRGTTTVEHLAKLGVLGDNVVAVHSVWLTDHELDLFAQHRVNVSHCPAAAMRFLGFARVPEMVKRGVCVSLGTDGAPSNNRMSLIDDMWMASAIHKARTNDPTALPAHTLLEMATCNGARTLKWDHEIGSLEAGKKADLIVIDNTAPNLVPMHDRIANLVTSLQPHNVLSVMVDGTWLMRDRLILPIDELTLVRDACAAAAAVVERAHIVLPTRFPIRT
eukprot:CAMPEP_0196665540 /NCGR_PEP_ID=MMETSP1086-20130531/61485_1 /TAXON_ID=77921 /ORGANISM="Cyanoptyche  gloeocystis , Strain SAG4.97" /LENGTH=442 /DNA_ID=CAMNT_0042002349 /DNA_START=122 /DNA_END=1450 /DNA_ORIENTATION=-